MKKVPYLIIKHSTAEDDLSLLRWGKNIIRLVAVVPSSGTFFT